MLATVFTKSVRDRWRGVAVGVAILGAMLMFGMQVYQGIDLSVYTDMPEALRSLVGIDESTDAAGLAYGAMYASYGALTLGSLALSIGAASVAGEEREGTIGLLLANPLGRRRMALEKLGALVAIVAGASVVLWLVGVLAPVVVGADVTGKHVGALVLHMFAISVFFGVLAAAIAGWTGRRSLASGTTAVVMVASFIAVGVLPLIEGWGDAARAFPWHYYAGSDPVATGVHWGDLAVLGAGSLLLAVVALIGVERRDLGSGNGRVGLVERLRGNRLARRVIDRLEGSARVSHIWVKALSDHQTLIIVIAYVVVFFGVVLGPMYLSIDEALRDFMEQVPEAVLAMVGYADMGTPEGWYQTENFSLTIPIALIVVTAVMGSRAMAGEEADRTMGLLIANPVSRRRIVLEKTVAMVVATLVTGVFVFVGTMIGSLVAGLDMSAGNVAATSVLAVLLSLVFGGLALAIGGATGRRGFAVAATSGVALALYIVNAFFPLSDSLAWLASWTPFHYYLSADPLNNGMPWGHAAILTGLFAGLVVVAIAAFERRDLRQTD